MPLLIAGDIFDRHDGPVSVVNLVLKQLFSKRIVTYAIPGQHDLPYHNRSLVHASAYGTLMEALPENFFDVDGRTLSFIHPEGDGVRIQLYGFGYDEEVGMNGVTNKLAGQAKSVLAHWIDNPKRDKEIKVALVHAFCYPSGAECSIPGIPVTCASEAYRQAFRGWDFVIIGDHHEPFREEVKAGNPAPTIVNCGGAFNRMSNERGKSRVGYQLFTDKTTNEVSLLSTTAEQWKERTHDVLLEEWANVLKDQKSEFKLNVDTEDDIMRAYQLAANAQSEFVRTMMRVILKAVKERK
jgi:DNA repair exonuclease SbcCD nuclease subunit